MLLSINMNTAKKLKVIVMEDDKNRIHAIEKELSKKNLLKKIPSCSKITTNQVSSNSSHNVSECSHRKIGTSR